MSTKISNAVRIETTDTRQINQLITLLSAFVKQHAHIMLLDTYSPKVWQATDNMRLGIEDGRNYKYGSYMAIMDDVSTRWKKMKETLLRDPDVDVDGEFYFYFFPTYTLCMIASEHGDMHQEWFMKLAKKDLEIRDYSYWNSHDKPSRISAREWEQRANDWSQSRKMTALHLEVLGRYGIDLPAPEELTKRTPKEYEEDCKTAARRLLWKNLNYGDKLMSELEAAGVPKDKISGNIMKVIGIQGRLEKEIHALPEFVPMIQSVKKLTKRNYTRDDILNDRK